MLNVPPILAIMRNLPAVEDVTVDLLMPRYDYFGADIPNNRTERIRGCLDDEAFSRRLKNLKRTYRRLIACQPRFRLAFSYLSSQAR